MTAPAKYSTLWPPGSPSRPGFDPSFWGGESGIEKIQQESGGWPHLVQLVAETCVDLLNDEALTAVNPELLERAFAKSVVRGEAVFFELLRRESKLAGAWECLVGFKRAEVLDAPAEAAILRSLQRRELVVVAHHARLLALERFLSIVVRDVGSVDFIPAIEGFVFKIQEVFYSCSYYRSRCLGEIWCQRAVRHRRRDEAYFGHVGVRKVVALPTWIEASAAPSA